MTWNDITYRQFLAIKDAMSLDNDEERLEAVAQAVYGEKVLEEPMIEFNKKCRALDFLKTEIPNDINVKKVKVGDREYYFDGMLGQISAAQYFDFQNHLKNKDEVKCFSVFFLPIEYEYDKKGKKVKTIKHKYNDGYDMEQVFEDILEMPVPIVISANFFFNRQFQLYIKIFQHYSIKQIKNQKLPKNLTKALEKVIMTSNNLVYQDMFSNFVK